VEVLGEFQVVTCNLAVHSQGLLSADKAGISPGSTDACSSKEPLKPLFNHPVLLFVPLSISFFSWGWGEAKARQFCLYLDFPKYFDALRIYYCP